MGWREQYESMFGGRRIVEFEVDLPPEETLRRLRNHLVSEGSYKSKVDLRDTLEVEDGSHITNEKIVKDFGCTGCLVLLIVAVITFGLALLVLPLYILAVLRRLRLEVTATESGSTRLIVSGHPTAAVDELEEWVRANLPMAG